MEDNKEFTTLCIHTKTGDVHAHVNGNILPIRKLNDGRYCFISKTKVLKNTLHISPLGKPSKYANIFNEEGQKAIIEYMKS